MSTTLKVGLGSAGLAFAVYATGMLVSGSLTVFGVMVMVPLAVAGYCIFGSFAAEGFSVLSEKTKAKLKEHKEKRDLDSLKTQAS